MDRKEVFEALNGERVYQELRWGTKQEDGSLKTLGKLRTEVRTVGEFICYMEEYLKEARKALTRVSGHHAALEELRKVVALGIACFEEHGTPIRDLTQPIVNGHDGITRFAKDY